MPHVILEVSDNVIEQNFNEILLEIHQILTETLPAQLESCKGRVIRHKEFLVGDGSKNYAFIHLSISVLAGRTKETLNLAAEKIIEMLKLNFKGSADQFDLKLSFSIQDLPEIYYKDN